MLCLRNQNCKFYKIRTKNSFPKSSQKINVHIVFHNNEVKNQNNKCTTRRQAPMTIFDKYVLIKRLKLPSPGLPIN